MADATGGDALVERAIDVAMDGIAILDEDGTYRFVNRAHADLYGYDDPEALLGESWRRLYGPEEIERFESDVLPALRESGQWHGQAIGTRRDGEQFVQELSLSRTAEGRFICVVRDETQRRERRRQLDRYESILENIHDGVYMLDADGRITWVNETAIEEFDGGYEREDLVGSFVTKILGDEDIEKCAAIIRELLEADGTGSRRCEIDLQTAYGGEIPCELNLSLRPFEDGEFQGTVGVLRDITDRKRREQRLSVLNRVLRHNLRNELSIVAGNADLMATELDGREATRARLIEEAGERIIELADTARRIEEVLDSSDDTQRPIDVAAVVTERCEALRRSHPAASIDVEAPPELEAIADDALGEAVDRLVTTVLEHDDPQVSVTVDAPETTAEWAEIRVADGGAGLPREEIEVLFEDEETPLHHGTGLGLWFVKWLVDSYGGDIEFDDDAPDGSVMTVRLRRATANR